MKTGGKVYLENKLAIDRRFPDGSHVIQGKRQRKDSGVSKQHVKAYVKDGILGLTKLLKQEHPDWSLREAVDEALRMRGKNKKIRGTP